VPQVEIPLYHQGRMRDSIYTPEPVARADFFVNCPKFKGHPWTTVTFSLKNYIGIQDDRHRLIDHDHKLNRKVADLQYITQPKFIAIDAITAGESRMLTPIPFDLGLVIMGNNQVAFDSVCSWIIGLDPMEIEHIRLSYERGFGPIELDQIEIRGDVTLDEAKERAKGFRTGLIRVEDYFADSNIRAWGGCPGALEEAIEIMRLFDLKTDEKMPPVHIVFGHYEGEITAKDGEKVIFIGDCASFKGEIDGEEVEVQSIYVDRSHKHPLEAPSNDIFRKMISVSTNLWSKRKQQIIRLKGCPVSVAEQVLTLVHIGKLKNPYLAPSQAVDFTSCYLSSRTRTMMKRAFGEPYNRPGPVLRGESRPEQNLPAPEQPAPLEHPEASVSKSK
jgi:hypothetical protein